MIASKIYIRLFADNLLTNISLYPQLWEVSGISYSELIDQLIQLAIDEFNDNAKIHYDFTELGTEKVGKKIIGE